MNLLEEKLRELIADSPMRSPVKDSVDAFEKMAYLPIATAADDLLFEAGTYNFTGKDMFYFSLTRQYQTEESGDEYMQLRLELLYEPGADNSEFYESMWSNVKLEDFFIAVRNSEAYQFLVQNNLKPVKLEIVNEMT